MIQSPSHVFFGGWSDQINNRVREFFIIFFLIEYSIVNTITRHLSIKKCRGIDLQVISKWPADLLPVGGFCYEAEMGGVMRETMGS
jgi:hypothetical protein